MRKSRVLNKIRNDQTAFSIKLNLSDTRAAEIAAIREIDFKNMAEIFNSLILPSATSLSIPLFFIVQYLLSKLDFFQSF